MTQMVSMIQVVTLVILFPKSIFNIFFFSNHQPSMLSWDWVLCLQSTNTQRKRTETLPFTTMDLSLLPSMLTLSWFSSNCPSVSSSAKCLKRKTYKYYLHSSRYLFLNPALSGFHSHHSLRSPQIQWALVCLYLSWQVNVIEYCSHASRFSIHHDILLS